MTIKRPALRYHGGKWRLAPWIISNFPKHKIYTEVYGGAASVLLRKERSYAEVYNDLDGEIVNLFKILRDEEQSKILKNLLENTPYSKDEHSNAYIQSLDDMEKARRLIIRSFMGFGSDGHNIKKKTGFRSNSNRSGTTPAHDWINYPERMIQLTERLKGVVIENKDAITILNQHDSENTLHYLDPPYVHSTRISGSKDKRCRSYPYEMTNQNHVELALNLHQLKGFVILSGYRCFLYDFLYSNWKRIDKKAYADGAKKRIESIWINPQCEQQLKGPAL